VAPDFPAEQALGAARLSAFGSGAQMRGMSRTSTYYWNTYGDPAIRSASLEDHASRGTDLVVL